MLLSIATIGTFSNPVSRPFGSALLIWLCFNAVLHNVWGDEYFLYSTHWPWALMALLMLGLSKTPPSLIAVSVLILVPAQLQTFFAVKAALQVVPR